MTARGRSGHRLARRVEQGGDPGERQVGVPRTQDGPSRRHHLGVPDDHRPGAGGGELGGISPVGEEGDVARPRFLEGHDPLDADGAVAFDATADPLRQLREAEVHGTSYFDAGAAFLGSAFLAGAAPDLPYLTLYRRTSSCVMLAVGGATMSPAFCCSKT